jgi:carbonic anhydrase
VPYTNTYSRQWQSLTEISDKATEVNARFQAELLRSSSTVIRDAAKANRLKITAGVYDLATGKARFSEPPNLE